MRDARIVSILPGPEPRARPSAALRSSPAMCPRAGQRRPRSASARSSSSYPRVQTLHAARPGAFLDGAARRLDCPPADACGRALERVRRPDGTAAMPVATAARSSASCCGTSARYVSTARRRSPRRRRPSGAGCRGRPGPAPQASAARWPWKAHFETASNFVGRIALLM